MNARFGRQLRESGLGDAAPPALGPWLELLAKVSADYDAGDRSIATDNRTVVNAAAAHTIPSPIDEPFGRLAVGIAHEINTPIQFIGDNVRFVERAMADVFDLCDRYRQAIAVGRVWTDEEEHALREVEAELDLPFLRNELPSAASASLEGLARIAAIAQALKIFAPAAVRPVPVDLAAALRDVLIIARNEIKYVATVTVDLKPMPHLVSPIDDLNQLFLQLVIDAARAIKKRHGTDPSVGQLGVSAVEENGDAVISFTDNGASMRADLTTDAEPAEGIGRHLAPAIALVIEQHRGCLTSARTAGGGTIVVLRLPLQGAAPQADVPPVSVLPS